MDAQTWAAIASVVVAVAALIFSVKSFNRQQNRADEQQARAEKLARDNAKPILWVEGLDYIDMKGVQLRNQGLGPAIIKMATFEKGGTSTDNLVDLFASLGGAAWVTYIRLPPKFAINEGASISLIRQSLENLRGQGFKDRSGLNLLSRIQNERKGIRVRIEYLDIFGNEMEPVDFVF